MRSTRRTFVASTLASLATPAILRRARADTPQLTLKLHHSFSAVSPAHDKFLAPWARKVEADSGGRIRIDIFPSMQLGGAPAQLFDQARDGVADIVWAMPGDTPGRFPKMRSIRAALRAVASGAGQFEGARGFRRRQSAGRIRRVSSALFFLPRPRRSAHRPRDQVDCRSQGPAPACAEPARRRIRPRARRAGCQRAGAAGADGDRARMRSTAASILGTRCRDCGSTTVSRTIPISPSGR